MPLHRPDRSRGARLPPFTSSTGPEYHVVIDVIRPARKRSLSSRRRRTLRQPEPLEHRRVLAPVLSLQGPIDVLIEGERADFTLRLSERSTQAETVFVTTNQVTATLGVDYAAPQRQQVTFAPGETVKRFSIATLAEAVPRREGAETFVVTATPVNQQLSGPLNRTVTIIDTAPRPVVSVADVVVDEGSSGATPAVFTLTLGSTFPRAVTVAYATRDGSATAASSDYEAASGTVTFLPGQLSQTVTVNVTGDRLLEPTESFSLILSSPTNATIGRSTAVGTIRNDEVDLPGFQISFNFVDSDLGPVPMGVQQLAREAAQRWSRVIVGDLPNVTLDGGGFIDDFELTVQMGLLGGGDGPGDALANAGPTAYRTTTPTLPYQGITGLDPNDVREPLKGANRNYVINIITHEIGHALGFAPGNAIFGRWVAGNTWIGPNAVREYRTLSNTSADSIPLETGGGGGTAGAHWLETRFDSELMTGYAEQPGVAMPLSRITVGAFADLGYTVSYAAAETYSLPRGIAAAGAATPASSSQTASRPKQVPGVGPLATSSSPNKRVDPSIKNMPGLDTMLVVTSGASRPTTVMKATRNAAGAFATFGQDLSVTHGIVRPPSEWKNADSQPDPGV